MNICKTIGAMLIVVGATTAGVQAKDTLKVGMDPLFEPFSFQTPDGKLTGFDYEISHALCDAIDVTCDVQALPYEGTMAAFTSGQVDVLINTYAMTPQRLKDYTMVGPYILPTFRFMTTANSTIDGTEGTLNGKTVGIEKSASAIVQYSKETFGKYSEVSGYDGITQAVLDLDAGRIDAVFGDENQLTYSYVKKNPDGYKMVGESVKDPKYFGDGQGFMLLKDSPWAPRLKDGLDKIIASGKYDEISKKYFGRNLLGQ
jgi:ABC-type amino acid transport substrate-binding protein